MKKIIYAVLIILLFAVVSGCGKKDQNYSGSLKTEESKSGGESDILSANEMSGEQKEGKDDRETETMPQFAIRQRDEDAIKEYLLTFPNDSGKLKTMACYQVIHGEESSGREYWNSFYAAVEKRQPAELVIAQLTIEGDVILDYVNYDGNDFYLLADSTRDEFAGELYWQKTYDYLKVLEDGEGYRCLILTDKEDFSMKDYEREMGSDDPDAEIDFYQWAAIKNGKNSAVSQGKNVVVK